MRVFLRSEEKKRDNLKLKEAKEQEQAAEVKDDVTPTPGPPTSGDEPGQAHVQGQDEATPPAVSATQGEPQDHTPIAANGHAVEGGESQVGAVDRKSVV